MPEPLILATPDLAPALDLLKSLGLRLDVIYPADDPHTAVLSHGDTLVRLTTAPGAPAPTDTLPPFIPEFVLTRSGGQPGEGRAGMLYRDLIPSRLGGRYVASHITIPEGGPVADWVHFHRVRLQLIFVRSGWVRVVYEDQGDPFVMAPGDLVLQPPGIRHRVLESSPGLEVVEIGAPALHETFADHDLALPNARHAPDRDFGGQRFLRHVAADMPWMAFVDGWSAQQIALHAATGGLADARILRPDRTSPLDLAAQGSELVFGFVLEGSATLERNEACALAGGDAFVVPPGEPWSLSAASDDLRLLHVTTASLG